MERIATFFHGTTVTRAGVIATQMEFAPVKTFLALGEGNRDLAVYFAHRTVTRHPNEGGPALVIVKMEEEAFDRLRRLGLLRMTGFDAEDQQELRNRTQWVLDAAGVPYFNRDMDEVEWEAI